MCGEEEKGGGQKEIVEGKKREKGERKKKGKETRKDKLQSCHQSKGQGKEME